MDLQLRVKDTGLLEGYTLYFNGTLADEVGTDDMRPYTIEKPAGTIALVIHFNGDEGGMSGIFDMGNGGDTLQRQSGPRHSYLIVNADTATEALKGRIDSLKAVASSLRISADAGSKALAARSKSVVNNV
jgi:hypothetical protein